MYLPASIDCPSVLWLGTGAEAAKLDFDRSLNRKSHINIQKIPLSLNKGYVNLIVEIVAVTM